MKKTLFLTFLFSFLFAKSEYLNIEAGIWNMSWEQNDKPKDSAVITPIENSYNIKDSLAKEFSLFGRYKDIKTYISYTEMDKNSYYDKTDKVIKYGGYLGYDFEQIESYFRFIYSKTDGYANGVDPETLKSAYVKFSTELKIYDLLFYPKLDFISDYLGIGYRLVNYTLPQSIYVISNGEVIDKFVEPKMEWNANYITISLNNSKDILEKLLSYENRGSSYFVDIMYGYGFNVKADSDSAKRAGKSSYIKSPKGDFFEAEAGYLAFIRMDGKVLNMKIGYRYMKQDLETSNNDDVYIYARAYSEFKGVFATIGFSF